MPVICASCICLTWDVARVRRAPEDNLAFNDQTISITVASRLHFLAVATASVSIERILGQ
jgi:hypothetical protein